MEIDMQYNGMSQIIHRNKEEVEFVGRCLEEPHQIIQDLFIAHCKLIRASRHTNDNEIKYEKSSYEKVLKELDDLDHDSFNPRDIGTQNEFGEVFVYNSLFSDPNICKLVPCLNQKTMSGNIRSDTVVKYIGIVQDVIGNEFYTGMYWEKDLKTEKTSLRLSKYRDTLPNLVDKEILFDDDDCAITMERTSVICSDIPGMSQWVSNSQKDSQRPNSSPTQSRQPYRSLKRRQDDGVEASSSDSMASVDMKSSKRQNVTVKETGDVQSNKEQEIGKSEGDVHQGINGVGPHSNQFQCLIRFYNGEACKINDIVECFGIYTVDLMINSIEESPTFDPFQSFVNPEANLPSSSYPRMQCLVYRKLCSSFPLLRPVSMKETSELSLSEHTRNALSLAGVDLDLLIKFTSESTDKIKSGEGNIIEESYYQILSQSSIYSSPLALDDAISSYLDAKACRSRIIDMISESLYGDKLLAEYILLCLLSRVTIRSETQVIGNLILNIIGLSEAINTIALKSVLEQCIPYIQHITSDKDALASENFLPSHNFDHIEKSHRSPLQIIEGTVICFDETNELKSASKNQMKVHEMSEISPSNIDESLRVLRMALNQTLPIHYGCYELKVPLNSPIIIFSKQPSILLQDEISLDIYKANENIIQMPIIPHADIAFDSISGPRNDDDVLAFRQYLALTRLLDVTMSDAVIKQAEEDFVQSRQRVHSQVNGNSSNIHHPNPIPMLTASDFHRWLLLARLIAVSFGETKITADHWLHMKNLERKREKRSVEGSISSTTQQIMGEDDSAMSSDIPLGANSPTRSTNFRAMSPTSVTLDGSHLLHRF